MPSLGLKLQMLTTDIVNGTEKLLRMNEKCGNVKGLNSGGLRGGGSGEKSPPSALILEKKRHYSALLDAPVVEKNTKRL